MVGKRRFLGRLGNPQVTTFKHTQRYDLQNPEKRQFLGSLGNPQVTTFR